MGLLFPILSFGISATGYKLHVSSCNYSKACYQVTSSKVQTSQFTPIWKFYDGSFFFEKENIKFKEATWDQFTGVFYFETDKDYYSYLPASGKLQKQN